MGLDYIEILIGYEEEFGIQIPNAIASKLETVGLAHEYIVQVTRSKNPPPTPEFVWDKMVQITAEQLRIKPSTITKDSYYVKDLGCG